ncbi:SLBB domain-containing protein [Aliikangiella sp. IMCC44359]|uniref:SLBB domain-containing protein n=1 Tax=Aliikangiella sp. IMCC44359 TaxID=3459125 RepID=UPI00403AD523
MYSKFSLLLLGLMTFFSSYTASIDTSEMKARCKNITPQQRQMAKMAGYDVDELCSSLDSLGTGNDKSKKNIQNVLPRDSSVEVNRRGVIGKREELDEKMLYDRRISADDLTIENGLPRYGYDLFAGIPTTFAPATDIPIPVDYIMGPGDQLKIQLLGKESENFELIVGRDGMVNFPALGPISLAGINFNEAKQRIKDIVKEQMIGIRAVVSLGELRSIRVFVLGEAFKPGSYTVSSLSTMTNALFVSGGIKEVGSLRNIQLKRQGKIITKLDLYDLLQKGDTSGDARLQPGDVIYIPPVGKTAGIKGEVKRPAIYELKKERTLKELVKLAGGYSASAFPNVSHITRKSSSGFTTVIDVDLSKSKSKNTQLKNGDLVEISTVLGEMEDVVYLEGTFQRTRPIKWRPKLKLEDIIYSVKQFKQNTDLNIGLIIRKSMPLRQISILHFYPQKVIEKTAEPIVLQPLDRILTFQSFVSEPKQSLEQQLSELQKYKQSIEKIENYETQENVVPLDSAEQNKKRRELEELVEKDNIRVKTLEFVVKKLREQTSDGQLIKIVDVSGNVRFPGVYPLSQGMNVRDLVLLAGGLKEASYLGNVEITRRDLSDLETATINHINVNLAEQLMGVEQFSLQAKDQLAVYTTPEYREKLSITIEGEVRFPGEYEFRRGETLTQVIARAGGFTSMAHIQAAVFTRRDLKQQEAKRLEELRAQMRADIAASDLEDVAAGQRANGSSNAEQLLNALSETEAVGRLVIALEKIVTSKHSDIQLKDGDMLVIPTYRQEVSVLGEVQHSTSHLFNEYWTLDDYLEKSGGLTSRADDERVYVVKADGSVFLPNQSGWLSHRNRMLSPGDTIVVPLDTDRIKSMTLWTNVTQIVSQLTLGIAALNSL